MVMIRRLMIAAVLVLGAAVVIPTTPAGAQTSRGHEHEHEHEGHDHRPPLPALTCPTGDTPLAVTSDVRLTHDLSCSGGLVEWDLAAGVTVDLGGHTVTVDEGSRCSVGQPGCTFEVGSGTLRNGRLVGADVNVGDGLAERLGIRQGLAEVTGSGELTRSVIDRGQVVLERGGRLTHSWVMRGQGVLLWNLDHSLTDFQVLDNLIVDGSGAGISLHTHFFSADDVTGTIEGNEISGNAGAGISLTGDLRDLGAIGISRNVVAHNGGAGIEVSGTLEGPLPNITGGAVTIARNQALSNGGRGINAPWIPAWPTGIVDGGKNVASGNAVAPACVGVTCKTHH
jgi:hypothetical protein